jgi:hypothetical protein
MVVAPADDRGAMLRKAQPWLRLGKNLDKFLDFQANPAGTGPERTDFPVQWNLCDFCAAHN